MSSALARVRAEPYDIGVQGLGVTRVQQAHRGIGVGGELAAGHVRNGRHIY
jgi:hypothetical protein